MITIPKQNEECTLLNSCIQLYETMIAEIKYCKNNLANEEERIQACFEIAATYKERINEAVRNFTFTSEDDEIFFFKKIKPLFAAEVEYYTYLYHIVLFKTNEMEADKQELNAFYKRQLLRKEKFKNENPEFYEYVHQDCCTADAQWFTRKTQSKDSSLFDGLMGRYLAIEKFELYLKGVINREL